MARHELNQPIVGINGRPRTLNEQLEEAFNLRLKEIKESGIASLTPKVISEEALNFALQNEPSPTKRRKVAKRIAGRKWVLSYTKRQKIKKKEIIEAMKRPEQSKLSPKFFSRSIDCFIKLLLSSRFTWPFAEVKKCQVG